MPNAQILTQIGWRGRKTAVACVATAALMFGCAAPSAPSASVTAAVASPSVETVAPSSAPAATETPEPSATDTLTPNPSPRKLCSNGDGEEIKTCELKAATYTSTPFMVPFQFTIDGGWTNALAGINAGQLTKGSTQRMGFGWATGMTAQGNPDVGKSTAALLESIASVPGISASAPAPVTIGGVEGSSIDFSLSTGEIFFMVGKSGTTYGPGEKVRAFVLDVSGSVVLLAVEAYSANDFDEVMTAVQPIVDSIVWE